MTTSETLCVLFNDIVSSTEHLVSVGENDAEPEFQEYRNVTHRLVEDWAGHHYSWRGDGFVAAFNSTAGALEVAAELQRLSIAVDGFVSRTGVAVGEVATQADGELFGRTLVVASRLCDQAVGAQVLCTVPVADLVAHRPEFSFETSGSRVLKGIPDPVKTVTLHRQAESWVQQRESAVLVGRGDELRRLTARLTEASETAGGLALVNGEPGAGKTRLVREISDRAEMRGFRCLWSTAFAGGGSTALTVVNNLISELHGVDDPDHRAPSSQPHMLPITELVAREWGELGLSGESEKMLTPTERRAVSFDALWRLIDRTSTVDPILLVFDDLQWADKGVADLVRFLGQHAREARVLLIAIYRTTEAGVDQLLADLTDDIHRHSQELVGLAGLSNEDATTLGEVLAGGRFDEDVGSYIYTATDGNPFLLEELVRHAATTGQIQRRQSKWHLMPSARDSVPPSVQHQLEARLRGLSEPETAIVEWIAVAGRPVLLRELIGLCGEQHANTVQAIDRALDSGIVAPSPSEAYDFAHPLVRDAVSATMTDLRMAVCRREFAQWLASTPDSTLYASEIAQLIYYSRALGVSEMGVEFALLGAGQAESAGDSSTAANLFSMARGLLPQADDRHGEFACDEALALTWAIDQRAADAVVEAADLLDHAGRDSGEFLADAVGATRQAYSSVTSLRKVVDRAMVALGDEVSATAAVVRLFDMAFGPETPDYPGIEPQSPLIMSLYDAVEASPYQDIHRWGHRVRPEEHLISNRQAEPDIRLYYAGDLSAIDDLRSEATSAERHGRYGRAAALWTSAARCAVGRGDLADVDELVANAERDLRSLPAEADVRYHLLAVIDERNSANGQRMALETVHGYHDMIPSVSATFLLANFRSSIGRLFAEAGVAEPAVALLDAVAPAVDLSGPSASTYLRVLWNASEIVWHLGLEERSEWLRTVYEGKVMPGRWRTPMTNEHLALSRLAFVAGDIDAALESMEQARRSTDEDGARPLRAFCDYDAAVAIHRHGADQSQVKDLLLQARTGFEAYGASHWPGRVDRMLDEIG